MPRPFLKSLCLVGGLLAALGGHARAQTDIPATNLEPVLAASGGNGALLLTRRRLIEETRSEEYVETVPYTEERIAADGTTYTATLEREEVRARTYIETKVVMEQISLEAGQFALRRGNGQTARVTGTTPRPEKTAPAVLIEVADLANIEVPAFYQQVLQPNALIVFVLQDHSAPAGGGTYPDDLDSGRTGGGPLVPADGVAMTIVNRSGQPVSIYYFDGSQEQNVLFIESMAPDETRAATTYEGTRWNAKVDDKMVSDFWTPGKATATWEIGPPLEFTSWEGDNGDTFQRGRDGVTWTHKDGGGEVLGQLGEEERTDHWVAIYDGPRGMWVRLMEDEAVFDAPGSNGWQTLARRANAGPTPQGGRGPAARGGDTGSALSQAEVDELLRLHNEARARVGVGPVTWSNEIAAYAQEWADELGRTGSFEHRRDGKYGENLAGGGDLGGAMQMWLAEKSKYKGEAIDDRNYLVFGHYTQIVWRDSTSVGCGKAVIGGRTVWVCNYDPPGNMTGGKPY